MPIVLEPERRLRDGGVPGSQPAEIRDDVAAGSARGLKARPRSHPARSAGAGIGREHRRPRAGRANSGPRLQAERRSPKNGAPALIFYHGGGWVICDLDSHDVVCRQIADQAGFMVFSVDYRLAPEHKFPAAAVDCDRGHAVDRRQRGKIRHRHVQRVFVGGDSAGGNLTAVVTSTRATTAGRSSRAKCWSIPRPTWR